MARSRNIKPGFFWDEDLGDLEPLVRILFAGLWGQADREGRLEDRPRRLKVELLPYDDCDTNDFLQQLADSPGRFIVRYEVDGVKYIAIPGFIRQQNPHKDEKASVIPAPPDTSTTQAPQSHGASTVQAPQLHGANMPLTFNPLTDSLNTDSLKKLSSADADAPSAEDLAFEEFWKPTVNKTGKQDARRKWERAVVLIHAARLGTSKAGAREWLRVRWTLYNCSPKARGRFNPHPAAWLHQGRYDDDEAMWQDDGSNRESTIPGIDPTQHRKGTKL